MVHGAKKPIYHSHTYTKDMNIKVSRILLEVNMMQAVLKFELNFFRRKSWTIVEIPKFDNLQDVKNWQRQKKQLSFCFGTFWSIGNLLFLTHYKIKSVASALFPNQI